MEENEVVGDVIDVAPREYLQVQFGAGVTVEMGNEIRPALAKNEPQYMQWSFEDNALYTICMVDPDAPSRRSPTMGEWLHWLLINVRGNDLKSGQVIMEYAGPSPPRGAGLHRYVFLVFQQRNVLQANRIQGDLMKGRSKFSTRRFTRKYNLGNAVAGNFFQSKS